MFKSEISGVNVISNTEISKELVAAEIATYCENFDKPENIYVEVDDEAMCGYICDSDGNFDREKPDVIFIVELA